MFCSNCGTKLSGKEKFCSNCGQEIQQVNNAIMTKEQEIQLLENEVIQNEAFSTEETFNFLKNAKTLETRKYGLETARDKLKTRISNNSNQTVASRLSKYKMSDYDFIGNSVTASIIGVIVGIIVFIIELKKLELALWEIIVATVTFIFIFMGEFWECMGPAIIAFGLTWTAFHILAFIFFNISIIFKNMKISKKQNVLDKDAEKDNLCKQEIIKESKKQLKVISDELNETNKLLEKLYNFDVIHNKYRNLVAVTTIYEYYETGRCHSLQGYTGAYNVYETELRQEIIIGKLNDILASLEEVKRNQYAVYLAIQEGNRIQKEVLNNSYEIMRLAQEAASNSSQIAESAKNTEYSTKRTAENSEILLWVEAFGR